MKVFTTLYECTESSMLGSLFRNQLFVLFQLYPDYYEIISEPTCLHMIDKNIQEGKVSKREIFYYFLIKVV